MVDATRFPSGVQIWYGEAPLANMPVPDASRVTHFVEDFVLAGDFVAATPTNWTVTLVGTGTRTVANETGGAVNLTNSAADNDSISVQLLNRSFTFQQNRKAFFKARLFLNDVTQSDMMIGITTPDTTPIGGVGVEETGISDGMFFLKIDGSPLLRFFVRVGNTTTFSNLNLTTMVNSQYMEMAFAWDGKIGSVDLPGEFSLWTKIDTDETWMKRGSFNITNLLQLPSLIALTMNMSVQNGEAVAKTMRVDNVLASVEREANV